MKESNQLCGLCSCAVGNTKHHIVPKSRGGKITEWLCHSCHAQIHALFSNKELELLYDSIEKLKENESVQKWLKWKEKHPETPISHKMSNHRKRFGKYH